MSCPFAVLGLPRKPLLSDEEIGAAYRKLAATLHPDQPGGDAVRFKELGEAASLLRDPSRRLRCLISQAPGSGIPPEAADLFPQVASLLREADDLLARHAAATNPLAKAVLAAPMRKLADNFGTLLAMIGNWQAKLQARLEELDAIWPGYDPGAVAILADSFSYAAKWESQLRDRKLSLDCL